MATVDIKNLKNEVSASSICPTTSSAARSMKVCCNDAVKQYLASQRVGHAQDQDPRRSFRQRQEAVAAEGHRPRASRRNPKSAVAQGRHGVWSAAPRVTNITCRKKMFRAALRSALALKLKENQLNVVDAFSLDDHKTKAFAQALTKLGFERKVLVDRPSGESEPVAGGAQSGRGAI